MSFAKSIPIYGNGVMLAPDGEMLCRCSVKKLKWYLDRDLAVWDKDDPPTIRLRFEPKGRYHAGDAVMLADRDNKCVVCGATENLNRHHIVPSCYRQYFPDEVKRHASYDIVPLCIECHEDYERIANNLKITIGEELGYLPGMAQRDHRNSLHGVKKAARTLLLHRDSMPEEKIERYTTVLQEYLKKDVISIDDLKDVSKIRPEDTLRTNMKHGEYIVKHCGDLQTFVERWRNHFLETMEPEFMIEGWDVKRNIWRN